MYSGGGGRVFTLMAATTSLFSVETRHVHAPLKRPIRFGARANATALGLEREETEPLWMC